MTYRVIVRPGGEQDLVDAVDWYEVRAPEQVGRFLADLEAVILRVQASPGRFAKVHGEVRRAPLDVFPYLVWYVADDGERLIHILAVTHHRRDPARVTARLSR